MADDYLPPAQLTGSGRPVLQPGEVECSLLSAVDLLSEENPSFPHLKSGLLILTTHRLLWLPDPPTTTTGGAVYIPLPAITHIFSTKKSLKSMFASPRIRFQVSTTSDCRIINDNKPVNVTVKSIVVTLIVRGKSDPDTFLSKLWEAWRGRAWESVSGPGPGSESVSGSTSGSTAPESVAIRMPVVGVSGILRKEQEMWESTDKSLQDAFQDLNALMSKAKEMVILAERMRSKLLTGSNNQASGTNDEEMGSKEDMQELLLSIGIISPVTKESAGALYHQQLSRQVLVDLWPLLLLYIISAVK